MGKVKRLFVCSSCERPSAQWAGRCSACGGWGTVSEHPAGRSRPGAPASAGLGRSALGVLEVTRVGDLASDREDHRIHTGFPSVDRVLGGGLVPGSVVLLAGAPGIGKSTLLLQLASRLSEAGHPCLLASGEEARGQVASRARRLGLDGQAVRFVPGRDLAEVLGAAQAERPDVLVVDSIHTIRDAASDTLPGGTSQVRGCADGLVWLAKEHGITVLLIGHVTKDGDLAGPRTLEHAVDAVLTFDGDPRSGLRVLACSKNRFGPEGEVAWFEMRPGGLVETDAGPRIGEASGEPGCATALAMAGRRAFAVDVQALVVPTDGPPRRQVAGLDPRRFHIVAAVTDRVAGRLREAVPAGAGRRDGRSARGPSWTAGSPEASGVSGASGLRLTRAELFGASAGGLRLDDPGADLAMAVALASAGLGEAPRPGAGFVGEVSLTGGVRPVGGVDQRILAARAAGLGTVVLSGGDPTTRPVQEGMRLVQVAHLRDALSWAFSGP